jgi:hypothetical protein
VRQEAWIAKMAKKPCKHEQILLHRSGLGYGYMGLRKAAFEGGRRGVLYVKDEVASVGLTSDTFAGRKAFRCVAHPSN